MTPKSNGLVEIAGRKTKERGFFCMELARRLMEDNVTDYDGYHGAMMAAKGGDCPYKSDCHIYARTIKNRGVQLTLFQ